MLVVNVRRLRWNCSKPAKRNFIMASMAAAMIPAATSAYQSYLVITLITPDCVAGGRNEGIKRGDHVRAP